MSALDCYRGIGGGGLRKQPDRIKKYLIGFLDGFEFLFLAESYILKHSKDMSFIRNVPVPFRIRPFQGTEATSDIEVLTSTGTEAAPDTKVEPPEKTGAVLDTEVEPSEKTGAVLDTEVEPSEKTGAVLEAGVEPSSKTGAIPATGVSPYELAENMAWIMGISPDFPHADAYGLFIEAVLPGNAAEALTAVAAYAADKNKDFIKACVFFRAALCMNPGFLNAMYGYARVCRDMYSQGEDNEYVGNFKAEALVFFELTSLEHPEFPDSFYYLGYAYLNMGLYQKAFLAWRKYLEFSEDEERQKELSMRIQQITVPMEIERGCNAVLAGRYEEGISVLEPHTKSRYKEWWPLYYYLGDAYNKTARHEEAIEMYKKVLSLKPSHVGIMDELASIYDLLGEDVLVSKYRTKAELIRTGGFKD
ncbi:hypothetical protein FACS1894127_4150 [Clostridia bacterium]|nr:hypothetical protein FACS1894127_4150 [Clostridia bacterium]